MSLSIIKDQKPYMAEFEDICKALGLNGGMFAYTTTNDNNAVMYIEDHVEWLFNIFLKKKGYYA